MREKCLQITPINSGNICGKPGKPAGPDHRVGERRELRVAGPDKPFLPIRAGHMKVLQLSVVDAFVRRCSCGISTSRFGRRACAPTGRTPMLSSVHPAVCPAVALALLTGARRSTPGDLPDQPSGLRLGDPNHLDKSLTFYDGGHAARCAAENPSHQGRGRSGGIARKDAKAFFLGADAGHSAETRGYPEPAPEAFRSVPPQYGCGHRRGVLEPDRRGALKDRPGEPEDDPLLSILLGRPLALVRAELGLEIVGLPAPIRGGAPPRPSTTRGLRRSSSP